jgi:hypothetical protein
MPSATAWRRKASMLGCWLTLSLNASVDGEQLVQPHAAHEAGHAALDAADGL